MPKELNTGPPEKLFTLPLRRFIERYLIREPHTDNARAMTVDAIDAEVINQIDINESMCHIQYEDFDGEKLEYPRLWWINTWKTHYHNEMLKRQKSAEERKERCLLIENTERIMTAMSKKHNIEREHFRGIAHKIAKRKLDEVANKYNTEIDKG